MHKEFGGLDIKDKKINNNETLIAKLKWRYASENNCLWKSILGSKYGDWREINKNVNFKHELGMVEGPEENM